MTFEWETEQERQLEAEQDAQWDARYAAHLDEMMEAQYNAELALQLDQLTLTTQPTTPLDPPNSLAHELLHLEINDPDSGAQTVGQFLGLLLSTLWLQAEEFSGKRPLSNSDWQYTVYKAMGKAGIAEIEFDEDGYIENFTNEAQISADELILQSIKLMYNHGGVE